MELTAEQKEILKLLVLIREYAGRKKGEQDNPVRISYIDKYIEEYSKPKPEITQKAFLEYHAYKKEETSLPEQRNTVRVYMRNKFLPFLEDFFKNEGKDLRYHLTFSPKGYYLNLIKNPFFSESSEPIETPSVSYVEHIYFKTQYRPILIALVFTVVSIISGFMFLKGFVTFMHRGNVSSLIVGLMLSVVSVFLFFLAKALARVSDETNLAFFIGEKFFLKRFDKSLMLTSYECLCPLDGGKVILTNERKKNIGYIAKCQKNSDHHTFSCDYVLLTGKLLSP